MCLNEPVSHMSRDVMQYVATLYSLVKGKTQLLVTPMFCSIFMTATFFHFKSILI